MLYRDGMAGDSDVVRAYLDAWTSGDLPSALAMYSDDFTLHYLGNNPLSGTHSGKEAALAALGTFTRTVRRPYDMYGPLLCSESRDASPRP